MNAPDIKQEVVFYTDGKGIRVTNARFIVEQTTYSMRNITSVKKKLTSPNRRWPLIAFVAALFFLLPGLKTPLPYLLYSFISAGVGVTIWSFQKATFDLVISSASGESTAITSHEESYIEHIVRALNEAILSNH